MLPPIIKAVIAVFLFLLIDTIGFIYLYAHSGTSLQKINTMRANAETAVAVDAKKYAILMQTSQQASIDEKRFKLLIKSFPTQSQVESLLENITKLGTSDHLKFVNFKPQQPIAHEFYAELPVAVTVMGQYHQIAHFLSGIANLPSSVVGINEFELTKPMSEPNQEDKKNNALLFTFVATIYYSINPITSKKS